jgi:hypothetical protein
VGLTFKRRQKKYASTRPGELMLVHQCTSCAAISINRIAADDYPDRLQQVYRASLNMPGGLQAMARSAGIDLLGPEDWPFIQRLVDHEHAAEPSAVPDWPD